MTDSANPPRSHPSVSPETPDFRPFSDHDISQARQDGVVAFSDGYKLSQNPYDRRTLQYHAWREGWQSEFENNAND